MIQICPAQKHAELCSVLRPLVIMHCWWTSLRKSRICCLLEQRVHLHMYCCKYVMFLSVKYLSSHILSFFYL